jgi:hypothetical protein
MDKFTIVFLAVGLSIGFLVGPRMRGTSIVARRIVGMLAVVAALFITGIILGFIGY